MSQSKDDRGRTHPPGNEESSGSEDDLQASTTKWETFGEKKGNKAEDLAAESRWLLKLSAG